MKHSSKYLREKAKLDTKENKLKSEIDSGSGRLKRITYLIGFSALALLIVRIFFFRRKRVSQTPEKQAQSGSFFKYQLRQIFLGLVVEQVAEYLTKKRNARLKR